MAYKRPTRAQIYKLEGDIQRATFRLQAVEEEALRHASVRERDYRHLENRYKEISSRHSHLVQDLFSQDAGAVFLSSTQKPNPPKQRWFRRVFSK